MTDIKTAPQEEQSSNVNDIISQDEAFDKTLDAKILIPDEKIFLENMPKILREAIENLADKNKNFAIQNIANIVLCTDANWITSNRIYGKLANEEIIPNMYSLVIAPSGRGKDLTYKQVCKIYNQFIENHKADFKSWKGREFNRIDEMCLQKYPDDEDKKKRIAMAEEEKKKIKTIPTEISNGTPEGIYCVAESIEKSNRFSLFLVFSEFGNVLVSIKQEDKDLVNFLYHGYDCDIKAKCIKGEKSDDIKENLTNIPVNVLMLTADDIFEDKRNYDKLKTSLNQGLCRRSIITFQPDTNIVDNFEPLEEIKKMNKNLEEIGGVLFSTIKRISNSVFMMDEWAYNPLMSQYSKYLTNMFNKTSNKTMRAEVLSRIFKVQKLSIIYAIHNHPDEKIIDVEDITQAICTVQYLSKDLVRFLSELHNKSDEVNKMFNFFESRIGELFNKTILKTNYFAESGLSRRTFDKEFDNIMDSVAELAASKGLIFIKEGKYGLQDNKVSKEVTPLNELL